MRQVLAVARFTSLESLRGRSALWAGALLLQLFAASIFLREISIADSHRLQTTFLAAASRLVCVFIGSLFIISAVVREFNDRGHLLLLSQDLGRAKYALGKFLGLTAPLLLLCLAAGALVMLLAGPRALAWTGALMLEMALIAAVCLFCALSLRQILPAMLSALGFYVLSRSMADIQLIAHASLAQDGGAGLAWMVRLVDGLALLLPRLDLFAPSLFLVETTPMHLATLLLQTLLYAALALAAASIDLFRREL